MAGLTPPPVTDRRALEGDGWDVPQRVFRPAGEQSPATEVVCTRLAQNMTLGDPGDFGGDAVVELVGPDGVRERFQPFMAFHKSREFEFGYGGSGPSAFAANILGLLLPPREAWRLHQDFKAAFVAPLPRDGGTIALADVRAWIEARWAAERADTVLMRQEAELRELLAQDRALGEADDIDADLDPHTVVIHCGACGRTATAVLPSELDGHALAALPALVHTRVTCPRWRSAVLTWPDAGRTMVVEIPE